MNRQANLSGIKSLDEIVKEIKKHLSAKGWKGEVVSYPGSPEAMQAVEMDFKKGGETKVLEFEVKHRPRQNMTEYWVGFGTNDMRHMNAKDGKAFAKACADAFMDRVNGKDASLNIAAELSRIAAFIDGEGEDKTAYYSRRQILNSQPRVITVKYKGAVCAETGHPIQVGHDALYYPTTKKFYSDQSRTWKDYMDAKMDEEVLGPNYVL